MITFQSSRRSRRASRAQATRFQRPGPDKLPAKDGSRSVRIVSGPLEGAQGFVVREESQGFLVDLSSTAPGLFIQVDRSLVSFA